VRQIVLPDDPGIQSLRRITGCCLHYDLPITVSLRSEIKYPRDQELNIRDIGIKSAQTVQPAAPEKRMNSQRTGLSDRGLS
jgi:hypothetical protein